MDKASQEVHRAAITLSSSKRRIEREISLFQRDSVHRFTFVDGPKSWIPYEKETKGSYIYIIYRYCFQILGLRSGSVERQLYRFQLISQRS